MKRITCVKALVLTGAIAALVAASGHLSAFAADTPIIISDGSLKLNSATPWAEYITQNQRRRVHPAQGKRVSSVEVRLAGNRNTTVTFDNQQCEVSVTYASTEIVVSTNPSGRNVGIDTDWSTLQPGSSPNELQHSNQGSRISRITVRQNGSTVLDEQPNGGSQVIVHYED